ncbi:single-stranded DNA-binding protein [Microbacterium sp. A84]|uniref:single-stranded DNA-binding protein n=1 Tax=Microbacterium sp. A84 TaxID=3450715 RepID=UPI003F432CB0
MNDTVTILGRVGADPNRSATSVGDSIVNFRVASPQSRYDAKSQSWIETGTNWYNVSAFRQLADHAKASLRQGDGVIVTGRLKLREWESGGRKGMSADIDAEAIGHDLRWGASAYIKANSATPASRPVPNENALPPADDSSSDEPGGPDESATAALEGAEGVEGAEGAEAEEGADHEESEMAFSGDSWTSRQ